MQVLAITRVRACAPDLRPVCEGWHEFLHIFLYNQIDRLLSTYLNFSNIKIPLFAKIMSLAENLLSIQVKLKRDPYYSSSKFKYHPGKKSS